MELYDVMRTTAAVREFTGAPLPDEVLARILDNARFAPSGANRQGAHLVLVRDQDTREQLAALNLPAARRYVAEGNTGQEDSPWNSLEGPTVTAEEIAATEVPDWFTEPVLKAAVVLVVCLDLRVVASTDQYLDRVGVISGASVYPLVWSILMAARNEGFGGTITTLAVSEEPAVKELLGIPEEYAVAAVVPLGQPVKQLTRLRRQPVEEFVTWERFDGAAFTD
jgi:nitroreductase